MSFLIFIKVAKVIEESINKYVKSRNINGGRKCMKVKKSILAIIVVSSISVGLMVGCIPFENSSKNLIKDSIKVNKENESIELFEDYSKKMHSKEGINNVKKDMSKKFSKSITDSGLSIVESPTDGSFVLSLGVRLGDQRAWG